MRLRIFYLCVLTITFTCLSGNLMAQHAGIDLLKKIHVERRTQLDPAMALISKTEAAIGVGIPIGFLLSGWVKHDKKMLQQGITISTALLINSADTYLLKRVVNRPRPSVTYPFIHALEPVSSYSFPSGHTSNAFVTASSISLQYPKWYVIVPAYTWAVATGYSRMHLGVHYPGDVVAGAILGSGSAILTYKLNQWMLKRYNSNKKKRLRL